MKTQVMLKILFLALGLFLSATQAETAETQTQTVTILVADAYEPFSYSVNGEPMGVYVDILRAVFRHLSGFDIELKAVPWERGKMMMENGKALALAPAYFHAHDWGYLYPYSIPLLREDVALICHAAVTNTANRRWPQDYTDLSVGNIRGFDGWGGMEFHQMVANKKIVYRELNSAEQLILLTAKRRLDCFLMEEFALAWNIKNLKETKKMSHSESLPLHKVHILGSDYSYIGYSEVAIQSGNFPYEYQFRKALDSTVYQMQKSGALDDVVDMSKKRHAGTFLSTTTK